MRHDAAQAMTDDKWHEKIRIMGDTGRSGSRRQRKSDFATRKPQVSERKGAQTNEEKRDDGNDRRRIRAKRKRK